MVRQEGKRSHWNGDDCYQWRENDGARVLVGGTTIIIILINPHVRM
jgi:hypothetical protein